MRLRNFLLVAVAAAVVACADPNPDVLPIPANARGVTQGSLPDGGRQTSYHVPMTFPQTVFSDADIQQLAQLGWRECRPAASWTTFASEIDSQPVTVFQRASRWKKADILLVMVFRYETRAQPPPAVPDNADQHVFIAQYDGADPREMGIECP